jgi:hypothetical protein
MGLSNDGLMKLMPLVQEMGGSRTGTALMSVMQNLANGRATTASVHNMMDMGLVNTRVNGKDAVEYDKAGRVKRLKPGAIKGDELLRTDPVAWVERYLLPKTKGLKVAEIDRMVNSILSNRTAAGLVMTMIAQNQRIHKDTELFKGARTIDQVDKAQESNYLRADKNFQKELSAARENLGVLMQDQLVPWLNRFASGLRVVNQYIDKHPDQAKHMMTGAGVVAGAAGVAGTAIAGAGMARAARWALTGSATRAATQSTASAVATQAAGAGVGSAIGGKVAGAARSAGAFVRPLAVGIAAALPTVLAYGAVAAGGLALGYGIGSLIVAGVRKFPFVDQIGDFLQDQFARAMPDWLMGVDRMASEGIEQAKRAQIAARYGMTPEQLGAYNAARRRGRGGGLSPQQTVAIGSGAGPLAPAAAATAIAAKARAGNPLTPYAAGAPGMGGLNITIPVTTNVSLPADQARTVARQQAGQVTRKLEDTLVKHYTNGKRPTGAPAPVR